MLETIQIPDVITCSQGTDCNGMEGLCILLKRLALPCRYTDMVGTFGRNPSEICLIFNRVLDYVYNLHNHRLTQWGQPMLIKYTEKELLLIIVLALLMALFEKSQGPRLTKVYNGHSAWYQISKCCLA